MKVNILTENLSENITILGKILPSHSQIPVLTSILLEATQEGLSLSSTDLEFGVTTSIPAKIEETGGVLVPGRQFIEVVSTLGREKAEVRQEKDQIILETQAGSFKFQAIPKEEFPKMFEEKGEEVEEFTQEDFKKIFSKLTFAVSADDARPHLTGVFVGAKEDGVHFVATDGYRMSLVKRPNATGDAYKNGIILSPRLISEVMSLKSFDHAKLYIFENGNQSIIEAGNTRFVGRLIEGTYPDYQRVIPSRTVSSITVGVDEFLHATRSITPFARENAQVVNLEISQSALSLSVPATSLGEAELKVEGIQEGEDNKIAFNVKFVLDFLKNIQAKKVKLAINSPHEPSLLTTPEDPNFLHVIMPVRVQE